ncbi:ATP-dependent protease HslVU (ClpYQ) peptidase subunit [Neobacillus sp. B4I6]|uniref:hypothetical protein n=1 Tax=Neobacillus sp. B4I6 TaxID=3373925 RepID=UPI003D206001
MAVVGESIELVNIFKVGNQEELVIRLMFEQPDEVIKAVNNLAVEERDFKLYKKQQGFTLVEGKKKVAIIRDTTGEINYIDADIMDAIRNPYF